MNTPRDVRVGTLSNDERCRRCGGENVNWCAPSPLWNEVMRGGSINGDPQFDDLVCPRCFIVLAYEADIDGQWHLFVDPEPDGLQKVTPSGRVWDAESWMWREPAHALDAVPDVPPDPPTADRDELARVLYEGDPSMPGSVATRLADALLSSGVLVDAADVRARALEDAADRIDNESPFPHAIAPVFSSLLREWAANDRAVSEREGTSDAD